MQFLAKTFHGLEQVLAQEIKELGGKNVQVLTRAITYEGDLELMYKSNYRLRTALRVLDVKKEMKVHDPDHLYRVMSKIPWEGLMDLNDTFAVDATTSGEIFTHSKYVSLVVKDAIVDRFRKIYDKRPSVNFMNPAFRINVHVRDNIATLSLDSSGDSLHLRGYRITAVDAPLNEVMAAGLVLLSGWDKRSPLLDPMCGGATISCEAARIAYDIPPQKSDRAFGFKKWKSFDQSLWDKVVKEAQPDPVTHLVDITASDKSLRALKVSQQNIDEAGLSEYIDVYKRDFFRTPGEKDYTIIMNPPYDERIKINDIDKFYATIGDTLKNEYDGSTAWIFSGNLDALNSVGLKTSQKYSLMNGALDSGFYKYELYEGKKD